MTISRIPGPLIVTGQERAVGSAITGTGAGGTPPDYNSDAGPNLLGGGVAIPDPRWPIFSDTAYPASGAGPQAVGWYAPLPVKIIDQIPAPTAANNIAAAQNATATGTALSLVTTTTSAANLTTASFTVTPTGNVVPSGCILIDLAPSLTSYGQTGRIQTIDATKTLARCLKVTGGASVTGGDFVVKGYDVWGYAMTETVTASNASAAVVTTKKAFKWVASITPNFADAHTYSWGIADTFGFPVKIDKLEDCEVWFGGTGVTSTSGFTAASASAATGDVKGTFVLPATSDGTKRLIVYFCPPATAMASTTGSFGVTPA